MPLLRQSVKLKLPTFISMTHISRSYKGKLKAALTVLLFSECLLLLFLQSWGLGAIVDSGQQKSTVRTVWRSEIQREAVAAARYWKASLQVKEFIV